MRFNPIFDLFEDHGYIYKEYIIGKFRSAFKDNCVINDGYGMGMKIYNNIFWT